MSAYDHAFDPATPGVHPALYAVMREAADLDRDTAAQLIAQASLRLPLLFRTAGPVVIHAGTAGALREMGLRSAVEHRALALVAGEEGAALADQVESLGKEVIRLHVRPGRTVEAAHLSRFLAGPEVDTVTVVHAEATAGSLAPLAELARVVQARPELLLVVDASHSLGASPLEMDQWGLDFVVAPSDGALGLPPGLAFAAASPRLLARARTLSGRGAQLDFVAHHAAAAEGRMFTPVAPAFAAALAHQLRQILDVEGLTARWHRHAALGEIVAAWAGARPTARLLAVEGRRAHALSVIMFGEPADGAWAALSADGWRVGLDGGGLRIGHLGDRQPEELRALLEAVAVALPLTAP